MNTERIKELAIQADRWARIMTWSDDPRYGDKPVSDLFNQKFAELIASEEREACAKVCEEIEMNIWDEYKINRDPHFEAGSDASSVCATAIRARGNE